MTYDPVRELIGIGCDPADCDHYRLLGLPAFVDDVAQIDRAYENRYASIRRYEVGAYGDQATALMKEVSNAYTCLRNPESKQRYDAELLTRLQRDETDSDLAAARGTVFDSSDSQPADVLPAEVTNEAPRPGVDGAGMSPILPAVAFDDGAVATEPHAADVDSDEPVEPTANADVGGVVDQVTVWLQWSDDERRANYYACLELELYESDPARIKQAVAKIKAWLRKYESGTVGVGIRRLLEELSRTEHLLLTPVLKKRYDAWLRARLAAICPGVADESKTGVRDCPAAGDAASGRDAASEEVDSGNEPAPDKHRDSLRTRVARAKRDSRAMRIPWKTIARHWRLVLLAIFAASGLILNLLRFVDWQAGQRAARPDVTSEAIAENPDDYPRQDPRYGIQDLIAKTPEPGSDDLAQENDEADGFASAIEGAHGIVRDEFCLWQTLPLDEAVPMLEKLRERRYRPVRFRPYVVDSKVLTAAVCFRDASAWELDVGLTSVDIARLQDQRAGQGLVAADVSGWDLRGQRYAVLWASSSVGVRRELMTGGRAVSPRDLTTSRSGLDMQPLTWQVFQTAMGDVRHCAVWEPRSRNSTPVEYFGEKTGYDALIDSRAEPLETAIWYDDAGTLQFASFLKVRGQQDFRETNSLPPEEHLSVCRLFMYEDHWPVSISAASLGRSGEPVVGSIWRKPTETEKKAASEALEPPTVVSP